MTLVARALERIGDNAVDIGEQVAFVVTGLFREFSDSSRGFPTAESGLLARAPAKYRAYRRWPTCEHTVTLRRGCPRRRGFAYTAPR